MTRALLDTGPVVALLDAADRDHARCAEWLASYESLLVTTEPVVTEATRLLRREPRAQRDVLSLVTRRAVVLVPLTLPSVARCRDVMERYEDVPMDFADATLVTLGEEIEVADVVTLDRRGFETYRLGGRTPFRCWPE
jgi:predicted nucleic acid-binding protein